MKKPILTIFTFLLLTTILSSQSKCLLEGNSIACVGERVSVTFNSDEVFDNVKIDAFTVINGTQELALKENITDTSADIIFLAGGDAEIVVRFLVGNTLVAICNLNVFVFDGDPVPALGALSNFVQDQITCGVLDLEFEMFINCTECPFVWTLNDEIVELEQTITIAEPLQLITARLELDSIGSYTFCHKVYKPDSTCFVEDCIAIDIIELNEVPIFSLDEEESIFCIGTTLNFINETIVEEEVIYVWEINYDTLQWRYFGEELEFDFLFAGNYTVSLQYIIASDNNCVSDKMTMDIDISDSPIIPITCSSNSCTDSIFTYQAPVDCDDYEWIIDESLGSIIENEDSGVTIKWNPVDKYTETKITLNLNSCAEDACSETKRNILLFPPNLIIEGPKGVCDRGSEWYETDLIPNAIYSWNVEMIDSISGIPPKVIKIEDNRALIAYNSYVGNLNILVSISIPSHDCLIFGQLITTSLLVFTNDNLCTGDLFKARVLPKIEQDIVWTLFNSELNYSNQQTLSGQDEFFAFNLNTPGIYNLDVQIPELGFECGDDIQITILEEPIVNLIGPRFICPGDSVTYTLAGLGANDIVNWTIFQNNTSNDLEGNEITILWEEGGAPYTIKVSRSTEVILGQICESDSYIFEIFDLRNQAIEVDGPRIVCYDAQATYGLVDFPGTYIWEIEPPYMGSIIEGDSTELITIQWHYAPDTPFATLSTSRDVCDSIVRTEIDVYFETYIPELSAPDTVCLGMTQRVEIIDLESYQIIEYYLNDSLVKDDAFFHNYRFLDTGFVEIRVDMFKPNDCPGFSSVTKLVYVKPNLPLGFLFSGNLKQCPKDDFDDINVEIDYQNSDAYYEWTLDGVIIKEGFGTDSLYNFTVTQEMIDTAASLAVSVEAPGLCPGETSLLLIYKCEEIICACLEDVVGSVDYLTPIECNLASFGGSLDFSTIINPYWQIVMIDTVIVIPINNEDDLVQDSFYFDERRTIGQVALRGTCVGGNFLSLCGVVQEELLDSTFCDIIIDEHSETLYSPDFEREYICNEDLTYDIIFTERGLRNSNPPYNSTVSWNINGVTYEGITIIMEDVQGGIDLDIAITQCNLDGTYCCTKNYETTARQEFSPNIILPNGSCENDLWLFDLDVNASEIVSALWDFGDGSGSTLVSTTKGFLDTLAHDVSVVITDHLGCVATAETSVKSFPNILDGLIEYLSDPCAPSVVLTYEENSTTTIANYDWSVVGSPDSSSIIVTTSGNYNVTVTDIHGCTNLVDISNISVNESFVGGLKFKPENCGVAVASIIANDEYSYMWFVDGEEVSSSSFIQLVTSGDHEIKVISTSLETNEICDSIVENIVIYPLPAPPTIEVEKVFCDPFIIELSLLNYPSAEWSLDNILKVEAPSIFVSQNGSYSATVEDENGCINRTKRTINEVEVPFDQLIDQCIQACREDLDSLSISIPGITYSVNSWTWITVDSLGVEYEVATSSGVITPLTITSEMYNYVQLQVTIDECNLRSEKIPLDIENCFQPEPPVEVICESINSEHDNCGHTIYKCLVSEVNGGPKLYFEGDVTLPMDAVLCTEDSLNVSLNNGYIVITDLVFEESDGKITAFYSANIMITDPVDYALNGTILKFDFCNEEGELAYCYDYSLPFRSCGNDFSCLIDYHGVSSGINQTVEINYCLNLSEVEQEECSLTEYEIRAILSSDNDVKTIFTQTLSGNFDDLHCISIPITYLDFFEGGYKCIELMVKGDCPGIRCSEYQCGIFGTPYLVSIANNTNAIEISEEKKKEFTNKDIKIFDSSLLIYPNPSTGLITFEFDGLLPHEEFGEEDYLVIKNSIGQTLKTIEIKDRNKISEDLSNQQTGLYVANVISKGRVIMAKRFLVIK